MTSRRDHLAAAALEVVARDGLKGLTHRAVDRHAGLPLGSAANVFPRRVDLVGGMIDEFERRDLALWESVGSEQPPRTRAELAERLAAFAVASVGPDLVALTRARLSLSLSHPDQLRGAHGRLLEALRAAMTRLGVDEPGRRAARVAAQLDGTMLHTVTVADDSPDAAALAQAVAALLS